MACFIQLCGSQCGHQGCSQEFFQEGAPGLDVGLGGAAACIALSVPATN